MTIRLMRGAIDSGPGECESPKIIVVQHSASEVDSCCATLCLSSLPRQRSAWALCVCQVGSGALCAWEQDALQDRRRGPQREDKAAEGAVWQQ